MKILSRQQNGQAMVEYIVVVFFSVMLLLAPLYDPGEGDETFKNFDYAKEKNSAGKNLNAIEVVQAVIQDNYRGYSYAISLSEYPDFLLLEEQQQALNDAAEAIDGITDSIKDGKKFVEDNIPPKLPTISFPGLPPSL